MARLLLGKSKSDFKLNCEFWISKIERNIEQDKEVTKQLQEDGWEILWFWDFEIKKISISV